MADKSRRRSIVLVHGAFVDGSGWRDVYRILTDDGFEVRVVQNPTESLAGDVAATRLALDRLDRPAVLVGHSYGGAIISEAGNHPNVEALVFVAAFAPDAGESVGSLTANPPEGAELPPILPPVDGFLFLDREKFHHAFAADVSEEDARFMADSQPGWNLEAVNGTVTTPAWKEKSCFYLLATEDRMIPAPLQRAMAERVGATVSEAVGSHAIFVSQPEAVAELIKQAALSEAAEGRSA